jgi:thiol-disulfide isomerase/thioredoxin
VTQSVAMIVLAVGLTAPVQAQPQTASPPAPGAKAAKSLAIGDPAPAVKVERFLKGDPIAGFEKGRVYVVEFWATWCGPCRQAMPHLSELQARYKDKGVTILSTNIREMRRSGEGYEEVFDDKTLAEVESFVRRQGDRMAYTVAYDGAAKEMDNGWMKASGSEGIPIAFIVDRGGAIAWIGHPMVLRMPLHEVAEGVWDQRTGPQRVKQAEDAYLGAMRLFPTDSAAGLAAWDRAEREYPLLAKDLIDPKFRALMAAGLSDAAYVAGELLFENATRADDASALNGLAWSIVDPNAKVAKRNLDLAFRAASKAVELTKAKDPLIMDTLARVHFCKGEVDKAIEVQSKAVELADEQTRPRLIPALDEYKKAKR